MKNKILEVNNIKKSFLGKPILKGIDFSVEQGNIVSILGLSGSGKTTLMRIIVGLEKEDEGVISSSGREIQNLKPYERNIGMIFQDYALFPHMNGFNNIGYGLQNSSLKNNFSSEEIKKKVEDVTTTLNIVHCLTKYPHEMSGGEKQRVALGRTLILDPKILIMDEPTSALDALVKEKVQQEIKNIQKKTGITTIIITHDQEEAFYLSDKIAIINNGQIEQYDTPENIYSMKKTPFVTSFFHDQLKIKVNRLKSIIE